MNINMCLNTHGGFTRVFTTDLKRIFDGLISTDNGVLNKERVMLENQDICIRRLSQI
jgi:hypothetical protein